MDTKSLIIDIATKLFQKQGYTGTGLNEILKLGHLTKGALYHHFPGGKEELLLACIRSLHEAIAEDIESIFERQPTTAEAIGAVLDRLIFLYETEGTIAGYTISSVVSGIDTLSDPVRRACAQLYVEMQGIFRRRLAEDGLAAEKASSLALMVNASLEGGIVLCLTTQSTEPLLAIKQWLPTMIKELESSE
ncbi:TetR/AcrR family transcriptional regulator [Cohnella fermenti]|uniref:TetR/AcrR family transcriptional regulator n=1 Tax=Cohnella fermenti TaxID=2565925 RepID=A0A4S4C6Y8_9BACL|nr:TetR/AcrR family transcriptional regulator [Cohnella fermenti]THF83416.1 TetR/AcrR family transcriptional regulator [Cohnella fermenti]